MKNITTKELSEVGLDLASEVSPVVVHGQKDAFDLEWLVEGLSDAFDSVDELRDSFQGEELALDGNEDGV
jgi:hypothetical protein